MRALLLLALVGCTTLQPLAPRAPLSPPPAPAVRELFGEQIVNTGPIACNVEASAEWANPYPHAITVLQVRIWPGVDYKATADVSGTLARLRDNNLLAKLAQDHYFDPNGPIQEVTDLRPEGVRLAPGEKLWFGYRCTKVYMGTKPVKAHFGVDIWWVTA